MNDYSLDMRSLAIGDIHGCNTALVTLLAHVQPQPNDRIVFLGDYIDRGPASRVVVETLIILEKTCSPVFLRGNHEIMMLEARHDTLKDNLWQSYGGSETLISYGAEHCREWASVIPSSHWAFFENAGRFFETHGHIFVHASLDPELSMQDQPDWLLFWEFFDRIRPHTSGKKIVCGHSPQRSGKPNDVGFAVCIDTGAIYGGWLTCLDVESGKYWQANELRQVREGSINLA